MEGTMRAVAMLGHKLHMREMPMPKPGPGEVLVKTLACGICGSDLHALRHTEKMIESSKRAGGSFVMDPKRDVVMGHEFCAEVVDHGPGSAKQVKAGTRVCALPILVSAQGVTTVGYSNDAPGGYAEYMRLMEPLLLPVPQSLSTEFAALTEPMAVGLHAVKKAKLSSDDVPLVIGCGPVGLAVIAALRLENVRPIVAADFSPRRRELALAMGADAVVDPAKNSPYDTWRGLAAWSDPSKAPPLAPWMPGPPLRPGVIFECVGVPGVIDTILTNAPAAARVIVVGVCMERDHFEPMMGISKEINVQFVLGYTPEEFAATLGHIARDEIKVEPLITGRVGLDGVAGAFESLATPETHAKILVEPGR
jgi:threonine dehydrogenase-like Zn-dependent dehydrogenase